MRAQPSQYDMSNVASLPEALQALARGETPFAGGTDLMVAFEAGKLREGRYFSLHQVPELRGVQLTETHLVLGASTTYAEIVRLTKSMPALAQEFPMLIDAARVTGAIAIQSRGTLGGNIANASPAADTPPALIAYDAEITLVSSGGSRSVPYASFHTGYKTTVRKADELISHVRLPRPTVARRDVYRKVGPRRAQAISKICFAGSAVLKDGLIQSVRVGLGSVGPAVVNASGVAAVLAGKAPNQTHADAAALWMATAIKPLNDIRSTAAYRLQVAQNLMRDFVLALQH